jgi:hypothetical protein
MNFSAITDQSWTLRSLPSRLNKTATRSTSQLSIVLQFEPPFVAASLFQLFLTFRCVILSIISLFLSFARRASYCHFSLLVLYDITHAGLRVSDLCRLTVCDCPLL